MELPMKEKISDDGDDDDHNNYDNDEGHSYSTFRLISCMHFRIVFQLILVENSSSNWIPVCPVCPIKH